MSCFENEISKWVVKFRWWIVLTTILLVFLVFNGLQFLTTNMDNRVFFSEDNPQLLALEKLEDTYDRTNNLIFVLAPKDGAVFTRQSLTAVKELTEVSWQIPYSSRVNSVSNFQHTWVEEDDLIVNALVEDAESLTDEEIDQIRQIAVSDPSLVNYLISPSGHVTGVNVNLLLPGKSETEVPEITFFARQMVKDFGDKYPGIDFYLTGSIPTDMAFGEAGYNDMNNLIPLMFLVLILITGFTIRSFTGTLGMLIIIIISMITGLGLAGWLGFVINAASSNAPLLILTLAVADSIHILVTMLQQMRSGKSKHEAIAESIRINFVPVFITTITTAIGFLTLNFSEAPPYRDLGNIVAMGVMAAFLYSVLSLPALMAVLPIRVKAKKNKANTNRLDWLANFIINNRKVVFAITVIAICIITTGIFKIQLQDNWAKYFDESFEVRRATDFAEANLTGLNTIEYSLEAGETGGINNPEYLVKVEEFTNWFLKQPNVVNVDAITNTLKRLNKNMHGDDEAYYRLPEQRDLAAQYLLLYEMSLPFGLDLNNRINVDKSATKMVVILSDVTTKQLRAMEDKGNEWLKNNVQASMINYGSGLTVTWAHFSERNINSLLGGSFWALFLISGIMIFVLRSFKLGLISLIPNLAPAFMAFGIWGIFVGEAGLGIAVIAAMTLGIVVDDTVHFMSKYIRARRELKMTTPDAIRYSFNTVGKALWVTSLVLISGFMILSLSGFKMNSDMGLMAAITITIALLLVLVFLPTLLLMADNETMLKSNELKEIENEKLNIEHSIHPASVHFRVEN